MTCEGAHLQRSLLSKQAYGHHVLDSSQLVLVCLVLLTRLQRHRIKRRRVNANRCDLLAAREVRHLRDHDDHGVSVQRRGAR